MNDCPLCRLNEYHRQTTKEHGQMRYGLNWIRSILDESSPRYEPDPDRAATEITRIATNSLMPWWELDK